MSKKKISNEYIRGLIEGEGCFTFCSAPRADGTKVQIPTFVLAMHERDRDLVEAVKDQLGLKNKLKEIKAYTKDGYNRGGTVRLMVRDIGSIKNIIVPFFHNKLVGYKGEQFAEWIKKMEEDPLVREDFKLIPRLCKSGFYEKNFIYE